MKKKILISTGGSGGHIIPAISFYEHLKNDFEIFLTSDKRGAKYINKKNYNYKLIEVYLNGNEALRNGSFHIDDADRTVILYIGDWEPAWGGFTHFMKSEKEHAVIVPLFGRMINFRSDISHKAYSFCNQNCPMRITAAFKLKL